jgi:hypothetical protein
MKSKLFCYYIMQKDFEISIPRDLSGITLRQYQEYLKMYDKWDKEDEVYFKTKVLQIFCGLDIEDTYKIPIVKFNSVIEHVLNCFKEETPLIKKFTMTGKNKAGEDTKVEFGFIPKLDDMSFGEYIDLENYITDWQTMHKAMSVLFRPVYHSKKEFYEINEYEGTAKYSEVMLDMPVNVALGAMVFFYRLGSKLPILTMDYLQATLKKEGVPQQLKPILGENGDGINQYIHLLKAMSEESMKLQKQAFISAL